MYETPDHSLLYYAQHCVWYVYQDQNDKEAVELQNYISDHGIERAITHFCELDMDDVMETVCFI